MRKVSFWVLALLIAALAPPHLAHAQDGETLVAVKISYQNCESEMSLVRLDQTITEPVPVWDGENSFYLQADPEWVSVTNTYPDGSVYVWVYYKNKFGSFQIDPDFLEMETMPPGGIVSIQGDLALIFGPTHGVVAKASNGTIPNWDGDGFLVWEGVGSFTPDELLAQ